MLKIKELLSDPSSWTQHVIARDCKRERVAVNDSSATCFCLYGALRRCYGSTINPLSNKEEYDIWNRLQQMVPDRDPIGWNDAPERTHAEVLELVTRLDI